MSGSVRIGVVLSSGGVRGVYAHTGFMQAINNLGIRIDASAGCSAGVIAIVPELPYMRWPVTEGGAAAQQSAREQAEKLLQPYMEKLMHDPRNELPLSGESVGQPASGCGRNHE